MYLAHVEDGAAHVGVEVLSDKDVGAIVAEEGGRDGALGTAAAEQLMEQGIPLRLLLPAGVEGVIEPAAALAGRFQLGVARIIGFPRHHLLPFGATLGCPLHCDCLGHHCSINQIRDS
ncbi:hypothetical protein D3C72_1965540 [compost metagenome]